MVGGMVLLCMLAIALASASPTPSSAEEGATTGTARADLGRAPDARLPSPAVGPCAPHAFHVAQLELFGLLSPTTAEAVGVVGVLRAAPAADGGRMDVSIEITGLPEVPLGNSAISLSDGTSLPLSRWHTRVS